MEKKSELWIKAGISSSLTVKLAEDEDVTIEVRVENCQKLKYDVADITKFVPDIVPKERSEGNTE